MVRWSFVILNASMLVVAFIIPGCDDTTSPDNSLEYSMLPVSDSAPIPTVLYAMSVPIRHISMLLDGPDSVQFYEVEISADTTQHDWTLFASTPEDSIYLRIWDPSSPRYARARSVFPYVVSRWSHVGGF